jgi:hypothetical protein
LQIDFAPSPAGEGWGEENKINYLYPLIPAFSLEGEGAGTCVDTYARRERGTKAAILARSTNLLLFVLRRKLHAFKTNGFVSGLVPQTTLHNQSHTTFHPEFSGKVFYVHWFVLGLDPICDLYAKYDNISLTVIS